MKKWIWIIYLAFIIILIGLIPLDLLFHNVSEWIVICNIVVLIAFVAWFWCKSGRKLIAKIIVTVLTLLSICISLFGVYCNPYWNSYNMKSSNSNTKDYDITVSYKDAIRDIDYAVKYVKKDHPIFLKGTPDEFDTAYSKAVSELKKCDSITVSLLWQKLQNILATLKDGHTCTYASYMNYHYMKYIAGMREKGFYLAKVNGVTLDNLFSQRCNQLSYDTKSWGMETMEEYLSSMEGLSFLGIPVTGDVTFTYENDDGDTEDITCKKEDFLTYEEYIAYNNISEDDNSGESFVTYTIDEDNSLALLTLTACRYNEEYINCIKKMFAEVKEKGIRNVAVDLRDNGGGNSTVANEFIKYLDVPKYKIATDRWRFGFLNLKNNLNIVKNQKNSNYVFNGKVYLLTSTSTFSSAMEFAEYIKDNELGTIIGEAPGNNAYGYGEIAIFQLPASRLNLQVSTKQFYRADASVKVELVEPDLSCPKEEALNVLYSEIDK